MTPPHPTTEPPRQPPTWLTESVAIRLLRRVSSVRNLVKPEQFQPSPAERLALRVRLTPLLSLLGKSPLHVDLDSPQLAQWWASWLLEKPFLVGSQLYLSTKRDRWLVLTGRDHAHFSATENRAEATDEFEEAFEKIGEPAHSKLFGYLTASPKLAGLGRRVEMLLHLPMLSATGQLEKSLAAVTQFGFNGKPVNPPGSALYVFSNLTAQGYEREELLSQANRVENIVVKAEEAARRQLLSQQGEWLLDQIGRARGLLTNAHLLEETEAATALTWLILGQELELEPAGQPSREQLFGQLWLLQAPFLSERTGEEDPSRARARLLRGELFGGE